MLCLDPICRACARAANAVRVPAGMFSLVADPGMVLFVSGASNLIAISNFKRSISDYCCSPILKQKWERNKLLENNDVDLPN